MYRFFRTSVLVMGLRALSLGGKFLLLAALARYYTPEQVAGYGLMMAGIGLAMAGLGGEFYHYAHRQLVCATPLRQAEILRHQARFHRLAYGVTFAMALGAFAAGILPWVWFGWFTVLAIVEHWAQEGHRLAMIAGRPLQAMLALFLRSGAWVVLTVAVVAAFPEYRQLSVIWCGWAVGGGAAVFMLMRPWRGLPWEEARRAPVDHTWLREGWRVSRRYLLALLCALAIPLVELAWLQHTHGAAAAGVYTFYSGIAKALVVLVASGAGMVLMRPILESYNAGESARHQRLLRQLALSALRLGAAGCGACWMGLDVLLRFISHGIYAQYANVMGVLLVAALITMQDDAPRLALYARGQDTALMLCQVLSLGVRLMANVLLVPHYGALGTACAALAAAAAGVLAKLACWRVIATR